MDDIKSKTVNGIKWSFVDNLANSGITFLVGIILARILSPVEFGILGIITIFITISNTIVDGGYSTALIRKAYVDENDFNTMFYCNLITSIVLTIALWLSSSIIADFFNQAILNSVLPVMSILLIVNALTIIQRTVLLRNIDFKTQAKVSLISSIGSGIVGVTLALLEFGVWSLVAQQLSRQVLASFFLWIYGNWRPKLIFSKKSFKELFGFGSKILSANLVNTLYQNLFITVIGKFYSTEQLGKYNRAEQFNSIFTNNLTMIIQKVGFSTLSSIQNETERLVYVFRKNIIYSTILTTTLVFGIAAMAKPIIMLTIGEKWSDSVLYLQILSLYGVLYPLSIINLNMLNIVGRSDLFLKLELLKKLLFIPVFVIGVYFNLQLMLVAALCYYYIEFFANSFYSKKLFNYGSLDQIKDLLPIFSVSLFSAVAIWFITFLNIHLILIFIIQILLYPFIIFLLYEKMHVNEYFELKDLLLLKIRSLRL